MLNYIYLLESTCLGVQNPVVLKFIFFYDLSLKNSFYLDFKRLFLIGKTKLL